LARSRRRAKTENKQKPPSLGGFYLLLVDEFPAGDLPLDDFLFTIEGQLDFDRLVTALLADQYLSAVIGRG
jgi:hypothetical protein